MVSRKGILLIFLLFSIAFSIQIKVEVIEVFDFKKEILNYSLNKNLLSISTFINNIGSIGFLSSLKLEINNKTVWTEEKGLHPGKTESFNIFYFLTEPGFYFGEVKLQAGNEIFDLGNFSFEFNESESKTENIFFVKGIRVKDDYLEVKLKANESVKAVVSIEGYPVTWKFEQKIIDLKKNEWKRVKIKYNGLYTKMNLTLKVFDLDAKYFFSKQFSFEKESFFNRIILDFLSYFI
ncbi:MAG: hypothetical protein QXG91_04280 [Candidatus Aenigmatarchaeota archaeon]